MVLSIVFYIKTGNIYPETNRDRLLIVTHGEEQYENNKHSSSLSYPFVETCFNSLESAEAVTMIRDTWGEEYYVQPAGSEEQVPVVVKPVDTAFWTVFPFRFLQGKPFTEADMQSGIHTAVIAESLARKLFGSTEVTGETIHLNFSPYRVCGVVKDVSYAMERTYAQLWIPYSVFPDYKKGSGKTLALGRMQAYILAPTVRDAKKMREEAIENVRKYNQTLKEVELSIYGQPDSQWQTVLRGFPGKELNFLKIVLQYGLIFFILLLVPAVSLSGMTESRMERRLAEMGVRRAFGAPVGTLTRQILSENFLFTVCGGCIGLLSSYLLILLCRNWIMQLGQSLSGIPPEGAEMVFSPSMLINLPVFAIALGVCFLLNLLSAGIPAWRASHREIIYSLNAK
jgi:putative ABC transport system permease protein